MIEIQSGALFKYANVGIAVRNLKESDYIGGEVVDLRNRDVYIGVCTGRDLYV